MMTWEPIAPGFVCDRCEARSYQISTAVFRCNSCNRVLGSFADLHAESGAP